MIVGLLILAGVVVGWCIGEGINARRYARLWEVCGRLPEIANTAAPTTDELRSVLDGTETVTVPPPASIGYVGDCSDQGERGDQPG